MHQDGQGTLEEQALENLNKKIKVFIMFVWSDFLGAGKCQYYVQKTQTCLIGNTINIACAVFTVMKQHICYGGKKYSGQEGNLNTLPCVLLLITGRHTITLLWFPAGQRTDVLCLPCVSASISSAIKQNFGLNQFLH